MPRRRCLFRAHFVGVSVFCVLSGVFLSFSISVPLACLGEAATGIGLFRCLVEGLALHG